MSVTTYKVILFIAFFAVLCEQIGAECSGNYDCDGTDVCCKSSSLSNECSTDCIGKSCVAHSDCGGANEYCCNYTCEEGLCGLEGWIIAIIVLSVLGGIGTIVGVVLCLYCAYCRSSSPTGIIVTTVPAMVPATTQPTTFVVGASPVNYPQGQVYPAVGQTTPGYGPPPPYYPQPQLQK